MRFEWDFAKDLRNRRKHGISFTAAATVFDDDLQLTIPDPDHSSGESRYLTMGWTSRGDLIVVAHTEEDDDCIRIISARPATSGERRLYEKGY